MREEDPIHSILRAHPPISAAALRLEKRFAANQYGGRRHASSPLIVRGHVPVLLSAPHAVNHPREGKTKIADTFTGPLVAQLAELSGASALIYSRTSGEDPNYDEDGPYKRALSDLAQSTRARFVLDIHGMARTSPMQLAIGTDHGRTLGAHLALRTKIVELLTHQGFTRVWVDEPGHFTASRRTTITSFTWRALRLPALQLEIHKQYRDPGAFPAHYSTLIRTLVDMIELIDGTLRHNQA